MVAAIVDDGMTARIVKRRMFGIRSKAALLPANRIVTQAPATASSVFPRAIRMDAATEPDVVRLTTKAPIVTTGQVPRPYRSRVAMARPVGGHTAVALAFTNARSSPIRPAAIYAAVSSVKRRVRRRRESVNAT